jgi:hypothetical protein
MSVPSPIRVSPVWRVLRRPSPIVERPAEVWRDPPPRPRYQAPPQELTDAPDHYEVPTGQRPVSDAVWYEMREQRLRRQQRQPATPQPQIGYVVVGSAVLGLMAAMAITIVVLLLGPSPAQHAMAQMPPPVSVPATPRPTVGRCP